MSDWSVEYSDDGGATFTTIDWSDFSIEWGLSDIQLAPLASVDAGRQVGASTGDILRIQKNGVTKFDGTLTTGGEIGRQGQNRLRGEHDIYRVFADSVSINESNPTDQDVLSAALSAASGGGNYTLTYNPTPVSLADDYDVDGRKVKRIFRDMTDRTDRVFYVGIGDTIEVVERGGGSQFAALSAGDGFRVESYNPGDIDTVRNGVTVNGTGSEQVQSTETDSASISEYGRRSKTYNFDYIVSQSEASSMASELLIPDPLPDAELLLGTGVGAVADIQLNRSIDFDDSQGTGASDTLTIEKQTVSPGSTTVNLGKGAGVSIANVNRDSKSVDDNSQPGSVYNSDRIADLAVATSKLQSNAVINGKLSDLSVSETKIQDDSIATPKLQAEAVTASEIDADTITAAEIAAGTITALEIESDTITAAEIDTLDLATNELVVGTDTNNDIEFTEVDFDTAIVPETDGVCQVGDDFDRFSDMFAVNMIADAGIFEQISVDEGTSFEIKSREFASGVGIVPETDNENVIGNDSTNEAFSSMAAHNFITSTPEPLSGVDASEITDYTWRQPPLYCAQRKATASDDCEYRHQNPDSGIDLPHITNYLFEVCKDQQSKIESLESTVADLQSRLADLEAKQE